MSEKFVENLTKKLKEKGITKTKLAREIEIPESTIRMWEKGSEPTVDKVIKISRYFAMPIAELIGLEENYTSNDNELLEYFHRLPEREQIKWIGKLEEAAKEYSESQQTTQEKIS